MRFSQKLLIPALLIPASMVYAASGSVTFKGTGVIRGTSAAVATGNEIQQTPEQDAHFIKHASGSVGEARVPSSGVPRPAVSAVTGAGANFFGFNGISHIDQRLADNGNQFSIEPPDQGMAVGGDYVVEAVNLAVTVYLKSGAVLVGPASLNRFFGLPSTIVRSTPPVYGPFTSDPRVYYDAPTGRWFMTVLEIDADPATGNLLGHSSILVAVSQSSDPTVPWNIYSFDTTDASNPGCPCFGDQPLIGADQNGFYITTNEFPIAGPGFNGAQIYALSKTALENNTPFTMVHLAGGLLAEGISYSVQPASTPPGGAYDTTHGGTEYFLSALDFNGTLDNRIAVWALTNTASLNTESPNVTLSSRIISSEVYGQPPAMQQKPGAMPLAELLKLLAKSNEHLELLDSNDDRMQQTVFAGGLLWSALNTVVKGSNGTVLTGIAWFAVAPSWSGNTLGGSVSKQGYVMADRENVAYPSIAVNSDGKGLMTYTLVGPDYFPSAAYSTIDAVNGTGPIQIAAAGVAPEDGFTGYGAYGGRVARWGDYSAAAADADGSIWMAVEYIPAGFRTSLANWGTFVGRIAP